MKKLLLASAALALFAAPSLAGTNDIVTTITISGTVAPKCVVTNTLTTIPLTNFVNDNGTVKDSPITVPDISGDAWCNAYGNSLTVVANPLTNQTHPGTAPAGFTNEINYTLSQDTLGSMESGTPETLALPEPFDLGGTGDGTITPKTDGNKLVAGEYSGDVVLTLTPGT